jgi:hypothetical protein
MHRLLTGLMAYLADLAQTSTRAWQRFFFTPADPTLLALIRIIVGSLAVWNLATLAPDLEDYLGSDGWIGPESVRQFLAQNSPGAWSFWLIIPDAWLRPAWVLCLVVAALFTVGFASRTTAVLTWAIAVSTARRAPVTLFGFDQMNATWILYLAVTGASGQSLSVDRYLARRRARGREVLAGVDAIELIDSRSPRPTVSANLALRLIQLHLALVYGSAGLAKLMGPEWWNGTALEMILLTPEFRRMDPTWFLSHPSLVQLATHAGLLLEIAYPVLIWVRQLRPLILCAVLIMHVGIDLMLGLTEFGLTMAAANMAFLWLPPAERQLEPPAARAQEANPRAQECATENYKTKARHPKVPIGRR